MVLENDFMVCDHRFCWKTTLAWYKNNKLSLIGIILRWGFLIWELIFFYCGLFVLIFVVFCVVSSFTTFLPNFTSGLLHVIYRQRFTWSKTWCNRQQLLKAVITGDTVTRLSIPIRGHGKSPEEGQRWNLAEA